MILLRVLELIETLKKKKNTCYNCKINMKYQTPKAFCCILSEKDERGEKSGGWRMVGSEPSYWNSREGKWDYGRKSRRLGALSLWSKVTQSTLSPGDSFLIQWLTWVWNLLQLFAFAVQRRWFLPCNHLFLLLPFLVRNSCEFKQQRWKSHCVIYPNHPLITRKVQLHGSWMFPVHWQPLIRGGKP